MKQYRGGDEVGKGGYWDLRNGTRVDVDVDDKGTLPGGPRVTYRKIPSAVMILAAPILGLAYVIALPFVAIGTVVVVLAKRLAVGALQALGALASFAWTPARAYLLGRKNKQPEIAAPRQDDAGKPAPDSKPD